MAKNEKLTRDLKRQRFNKLRQRYIDHFVDTLPVEERDDALDFLINLIGQEIAIEDAKVATTNIDRSKANLGIPYVEQQGDEIKNYPLRGYNVVGIPPTKIGLVGAIGHIADKGFCKELGNYQVAVYPEIKLAVVINGRHHLSIAGLLGSGVADAQMYPLSDIAEYLSTDGSHWLYYGPDGTMKSEELDNPDIGFLYELYRYKKCRKRMALCTRCGCYVEYTTETAPDTATIRGIQFDYIEQIARCPECKNEVYVSEFNNANAQAREEAFRKAKDLPKPV